MPVLARADFVENFAQRINVRLNGPWSFGWNESFRPHVPFRFRHFSDQTNIGQLRNSIHEDNVRRLNVPMDQSAKMQKRESGTEWHFVVFSVFSRPSLFR